MPRLDHEQQIRRVSQTCQILYTIILDNKINNRHSYVTITNIETLQQLQTLMHEVNPIAHDFKTTAQYVEENPNHIKNILMVFQSEGVPDQRRYNVPTNSTEIGTLILNSNNAQTGGPNYRDTVIRSWSWGNLQRINELNQMYDPFS